jgi:hypothetical protein
MQGPIAQIKTRVTNLLLNKINNVAIVKLNLKKDPEIEEELSIDQFLKCNAIIRDKNIIPDQIFPAPTWDGVMEQESLTSGKQHVDYLSCVNTLIVTTMTWVWSKTTSIASN